MPLLAIGTASRWISFLPRTAGLVKSMRPFLGFYGFGYPLGFDRADNRLAACVHGDVLYLNLLDFAAMTIQSFNQNGI